jgi:ribonuclease J
LTPRAGDTVIVSASPIPGNETAILRIIDQLFARGVNVVYSAIGRVHVSGHASRDELARMLALTRPRFVVPFHGEARHLALYARLAEEEGIDPARILRADLGTVIELGPGGARTTETVPAGHVYVSGSRIGGITDTILEERQGLTRAGIVCVAVTIARDSGDLLAGPTFAARGFLPDDEANALFARAAGVVREAIAGCGPESLPAALAEATSAALWAGARRRPTIVPVVTTA